MNSLAVGAELDDRRAAVATVGRLTVAELQDALRLARARSSSPGLHAARSQAPASEGLASVRAAEAPVDAAPPWCTAAAPAGWVAVVGAHAGAGASTVALAIADAAAARGRAVRLIEWADPIRSGLASVARSELGVCRDGQWRRGSRGPTAVDRRTVDARTGDAQWPVETDTDRLPLADIGPLPIALLEGDAGALPGVPAVVVCRASVPGIRNAERLLASLARPVAVAAVGSAKWPGVLAASTGPRLRDLRERGRVIGFPVDRQLELTGLTCSLLPKSILSAGRALLVLLELPTADGTPDSRAPQSATKGSNR